MIVSPKGSLLYSNKAALDFIEENHIKISNIFNEFRGLVDIKEKFDKGQIFQKKLNESEDVKFRDKVLDVKNIKLIDFKNIKSYLIEIDD